MKTTLVKLAGKSGYCCKIFLHGRHVATVADPDPTHNTRDAALVAANKWNLEWRPLLFPKGSK